MGLMRKTVKISTFGLAPIHYRDKEERIIKANERELQVQRQMLDEQRVAGRQAHADATAVDSLVQLERLARLRDQGVLTDAEFTAQKRPLLAGAPDPRDFRGRR